ncbi:hypothetical protein [Corynebacterium heidelbergense]|uniref:Uncharacterized protein n=1 Tax=Corynebacterium heidelbergense TaxID=2055947 RepID=A0A364V918_9CORY|nr:hypothetical protein [Corynebacterium heidelbergense]RAV33117.1 hypothetical protein DLJ54_00410 [Corynebacterium heidelbergense]
MNSDIRWALPSDGHTFPIYAGPVEDMDRVAEFADERGVQHIYFGGDMWRLHCDDGPEASAETATGTWRATADKDKFRNAEHVRVEADRHVITITAESSRNFVMDIDGDKAGQFTSAGRGLRNLHVEFEGPGEKLPLDVQIFVSWVARRCMETRMVRSTWMWTLLMLLFIPIAILYWMGLLPQ